MKKKHGISLVLAVAGALLMMTQFSAIAADKVVVIPLFSSGSGDKIPTVTSETGRVWMDRNLGAIRVAGSVSDSLAYGWLYQWGRPADGHESRTSPTDNTTVDYDVPGHGRFIINNAFPSDWRLPQNNGLWQGENGLNNPCPPGFRIPTQAEWQQESDTWNGQNSIGAYESKLKLTNVAFRSGNNGDVDEGNYGYYWTTTVPDNNYSTALRIFSGLQYNNYIRAHGFAVRCIKN